ncbi:MAG: DUF2147 domain-containing protein [Gemmatimonadaceae bacterium]
MITPLLRRRLFPRLFFVVGLLYVPQLLSAQSSPVGLWRTISDVDGKPSAIVEITEENGIVSGAVKRSLIESDSSPRVCHKCSGELKERPVVGMRILTGLHLDGSEWRGGTILDPDSGKIYKAKLRVSDDGESLVLRGFIGFSLLGRSQTWHRER